MNGKFESNSNNYDEPNLKSVSLGFWPESKRSPGERSDTRDSLERAPAYRCAHAGYNSRLRSIRNHRLAMSFDVNWSNSISASSLIGRCMTLRRSSLSNWSDDEL